MNGVEKKNRFSENLMRNKIEKFSVRSSAKVEGKGKKKVRNEKTCKVIHLRASR